MADKYLRSAAAGAGTGADWTNAYTTLSVALAGMAAGDRLWVADDHAENVASAQTYTSPGTQAAPCKILCVDHTVASGFVSANLKKTASVKTTGANTMTFAGYAYVYGVIFLAGANTSNVATSFVGAASGWTLDYCQVGFGGTGSTSSIKVGAQAQGSTTIGKHTFRSTTFKFVNASNTLQIGAVQFEICRAPGDTATTDLLASGTVPSTLFNENTTGLGAGNFYIHDCYLSSATLVAALTRPHHLLFERCRLGSSFTVTTPTNPAAVIDLVNCDDTNGNVNYRNARFTYQGTLTTETTIRVTAANGGASDGATDYSHKIVTTANASRYFPFESIPFYELYVDTLNVSVSQTFELMTDNVVLTNADVWVELYYLGDAGTGVLAGWTVTNAPADPLAAAANLSTSTKTWTTTGLGTPKPQKIALSFTPQKKGYYRAVLKVGKPSATLYFSPPAAKAA